MKFLSRCLALLVFVYVFFISLGPLSDPDFWWHLKTGQWIVQNKALPGHEDPFSYTTPRPLSDGAVSGIRSQWLGQVVLYLVYLSGGYPGLSVFRSLLIVLPFVYLYFRFVKKGIHPLLLIAFLSFPPLIIGLSQFYTFERPQAFSFILAIVVFLLLKKESRPSVLTSSGKAVPSSDVKGSLTLWLLPLIMLLWANLHGGYIVGVVIIGAYMAGEAVSLAAQRLRFIKVETPAKHLHFFIACLVGIAVTGLRPGGYDMLVGWLRSFFGRLMNPADSAVGIVAAEILEYKPLWYFYKVLHYKWPLFMMAFIAVGALALVMKYISRRRLDPAEALVSFLIGFLGLYYARGVNFTLIFFSFIIGNSLISIRGVKKIIPPVVVAAVSFTMLLYVFRTTPWDLKPTVPHNWVNTVYPERAVRFLREHGIKGPMFNEMKWGGYLIWKTYPEYKVFFDSRLINAQMTDIYMRIVNAAPMWKNMLDTFNVNFLLIPVMSRESGVISPVVMRLAEEKPDEWRLVYLWDNKAIFLRNTGSNQKVIQCCSIPFSELYREIVDLSDLLLIMMPGHPDVLMSKAIALYGLQRFAEAKQILLTLPRIPLSDNLLEKLKDY